MIEDIVKSDLKTILHSKRANLYYLEKCRIMQKDGRIVYLTETKKENLFWNIPIANTTVILLGSGTSVTQAAMRLLSTQLRPSARVPGPRCSGLVSSVSALSSRWCSARLRVRVRSP